MYKKITKKIPIASSIGGSRLFLIMKLTLFLIIMNMHLAVAVGYGQRINIVKKQLPLHQAFKEIREQSGYNILINSELLKTARPVNLNLRDATLQDALRECLKEQSLAYEIINKNVIIKLAPKNTSPVQQERQVKGKVRDANGQPIVGASVGLKGNPQRVTKTNDHGEFLLTVQDGAVIVVSYLGFTTQELALGDRSEVSITLEEEEAALDEVVVVGYNTVRKTDLTGAVSSISAEQVRRMPVTNALQAMQGMVAGVDITSNERPGEMGNVTVRGIRSLSASNSPLYVVDGIPLAAGGIEAINPSDIESIDVLKDASATAIFGSRGANGVIIVNTKRGKEGRLSLNYLAVTTIERMSDLTEMMDAAEYIEFRRDAFRRLPAGNPNRYPEVPSEDADARIFANDSHAWANIARGWQGGTWNPGLVATTNWTDMVLRTGVTHDHSLNASGGTDKMQAYGSFGYLNQGGTQLGQDYQRYTGKFTVDLTPVPWFKMGGSLTATFGDQNYGYQGSGSQGAPNLYFAARSMLPYAVPFDDEGNRINLPGGDVNIRNPIGEHEYTINERKVLRTLGNIYAEVNFLEGLKYRVNFGPDFYNFRNGRWMDAMATERGAGEPGSTNFAELGQTMRFSWTLDNLLYYNRTFQDKHDLGVTLLQSASANRTETSLMTATDLPWDSQRWYQLNSVSELDRFGTGLSESQLLSYMARVNYGFNDRYLFTGSVRWDGASQLADGNKWDFFPSAAVAWRMDQESFMQNVSWVDQLKLRLGFGTTGNAAIEPYMTKGGVETLYYTWGGIVEPGYVSSDASLANPAPMANLELGWERTTQWNLGIDFNLLNGRLNGALDLYTSKTTDLLMEAAIPSVTGYTRTWANIGSTANKGVDLSLNTVNVSSGNFYWESGLNFTMTTDRIVELSNGKVDDPNNLWFIGRRLAVFYDYEKVGIWQDTPEDHAEMAKFLEAGGHEYRPGDIRVADLNGDYIIDANNDRKIVGHSMPKWTAGLNNTVRYKNWDLTFFLYGRFGFTIEAGGEYMQGRFAQRRVDYWRPDNPTNEYPAPNYGNAGGDQYRTSMNYQDGSFIKLRNVSLGYTLPQSYAQRLGLGNMKIFAQAMNPGLIYSKVDWLDPDLGGSTFNRGFVIGLNVGF
ncbi:TonB-linked outer membrane protein, SusC/RagA family [Parapedobacter composti]|uniref:TonB-linked outer membrane protein, SusC/RagA family n=2 Tax=Parapedobacter composti TaxID=623281 RepID=A0A1I1E107_9SPHI|nr:TonB-linked outer membrane protein, SusC/RagA family [Parapedobacter composti]